MVDEAAPPTPERPEDPIERIAQAYLEALERGDQPDRGAFLEAHPELGDALRHRIDLMDMIHGAQPAPEPLVGGAGLGGPPKAPPGTPGWLEGEEPDEQPGMIGPYRILQLLGRGGMGEVYLVEQMEPVRRRLALKMMRLGMDTEDLRARFEVERQALALMNHPCIVKMHEAGSTENGRLYFTMEFIPGISITEFADRNVLSIPERLQLFRQLCEGVQHAHQKGIIHRSLKPSDVLVTDEAGRPRVKIIDFGVAKVIFGDLAAQQPITEVGCVIGTPEYMSPEQAEASGMDVDTRTDVYALGCILYELLVGVLPFDSKELRAADLTGLRQRARSIRPPLMSHRLGAMETEGLEMARLRGTKRSALARWLREDLDWIVIKAMEKDRTRRYSSAAELSEDIQRSLNGEPVQAMYPSLAYRLRKVFRRWRPRMAVAAVLVAILIFGLGALVARLGG